MYLECEKSETQTEYDMTHTRTSHTRRHDTRLERRDQFNQDVRPSDATVATLDVVLRSENALVRQQSIIATNTVAAPDMGVRCALGSWHAGRSY